jgi:membrane-bound serine protease (ClpP class)
MKGVAITPLRPAGRVQIVDRIVDAVADGAFVEAGEPIRVVSASGFRTVVVHDVA